MSRSQTRHRCVHLGSDHNERKGGARTQQCKLAEGREREPPQSAAGRGRQVPQAHPVSLSCALGRVTELVLVLHKMGPGEAEPRARLCELRPFTRTAGLSQGDFATQGTWAHLGHVWLSHWAVELGGVGMLLASSGWSQGSCWHPAVFGMAPPQGSPQHPTNGEPCRRLQSEGQIQQQDFSPLSGPDTPLGAWEGARWGAGACRPTGTR